MGGQRNNQERANRGQGGQKRGNRGQGGTGGLFLCGETAFAFWQALRTMGRPRLDQRTTLPRLLDKLGIKAVRATSSFGGPPPRGNPWPPIVSTLEHARTRAANSPELPAHGAEADGPVPLPYASPAHLLVGSSSARRNASSKICHIWNKEIPPFAFVRMGENVYLSRPEFVFVQLAPHLGAAELVLLGYEMCGFFAVHRVGIAYARRCLPLATAGSLLRFLDGVAPGTHGLREARRAARLVVDHAGSIGEAATVALLCTARAKGGYGIPLPTMNAPVPIPAKLRELLGPTPLICDAYWPRARFALEYDGRLDHEGADAVAHDHARANRLSAAGVIVETITRRDLFSPHAFDKTARRIARRIGYELFSRDFDTDWRKSRAGLRDAVLGFAFGKDGSGRDLKRPLSIPLAAPPFSFWSK